MGGRRVEGEGLFGERSGVIAETLEILGGGQG